MEKVNDINAQTNGSVNTISSFTTITTEKKLRGEICIRPIDSKSPVILSDTMVVGPFSFLDPSFNKPTNRIPPPVYLSMPILTKPRQIEKNEILKGLLVTPTGELKLVDEDMLKKQRGVVLDVIKKLAKNVLEGRGVIGISLPVRIFEPRSTLERIIDWWSFGPIFLSEAAKTADPVAKMKLVVAFAISGLYISGNQNKPFNPLLGETYQGHFEDGTEIYCEHTSHHPPIANFLLINKLWKFYGRYEFVARLSKNTLQLLQEGPNNIEFSDGTKITFYLPGIKAKGMIMGDRLLKYHRVAKFIDEKNGIKALIKLNSEKKKGLFAKKKSSDGFEGKLYYTKPLNQGRVFKNRKEEDKFEMQYLDVKEEIAPIRGSWLTNLIIGEEEIWNIDQFKPARYQPIDDPLPSDCRFREDLIWLKYGDTKNAEDWKLRLEEQQRWDRKIRQENQGIIPK